MALVPAWDKRTGKRVALTPEPWIGHPILGPHLTATPPKERRPKATDTPVEATPQPETEA